MVRVKLIVRVIPEDVYIRDLESRTQPSVTHLLAEEKRLLQVVDDPERTSIGVVANEIKSTFQKINRDLLGDIKYLKDGEADADLDPDMSVYDAFVNAGKAATFPDDQTATMKIIREIRGQKFGIREGSVVPDLSNPRFLPRRPPPVPRFSDTHQGLGKRSRDDGFTEETSKAERAPEPNPTRRRRLDVLGDGMAQDRLVPSIEPDICEPSHGASRQKGSPVVIPETQDSPLQYGAEPHKGGSDILGDDEPKSESPEIDNSIHSLPMARKDVKDVKILETMPHTQDLPAPKSRLQDAEQAISEAAPANEPTSRSSSNYYSPVSGSLQSVANEHVYSEDSASKRADNRGVSNPVDLGPNATRARSSLAREGTVENGPITPSSSVSYQRHLKATTHDPNHILSSGAAPPSRTSSFSAKFRRVDRLRSDESEIDDTQMSPRSRKSLKRPRNASHSETALMTISVEELHDEKQPLIQERKRQRKHSKRGFSEQIEGVSDAEDVRPLSDKHRSQDEAQQPNKVIDVSESDEGHVIAWARPQSHALSNATSKESNASTECQTTSINLNAVRLSQPAQNPVSSHGASLETTAENESDKENANHEQAMYLQLPSLNLHQDVDEKTRGPSRAHEKEQDHDEKEGDVQKRNDDSIGGTINRNTSSQTRGPAKVNTRSAQRLHRDVPKQLQTTSGLPDLASPRRLRSRRKKSCVEEEKDTLKPEAQPAVTVGSNQQKASSDKKSKLKNKIVPFTAPDEQLSQDLQASAQAGSNNVITAPKKWKASAQQQISSTQNAARFDNANSSGKLSVWSVAATKVVGEKSSVDDQERSKSSDYLENQGALRANAEPAAIEDEVPARSLDEEKGQDGKLGLGFSQSSPQGNRSFMESNVSLEDLDDEGQSKSSEVLPGKDEGISYLKKSKSFERVMSSPSWSDDTPSRSAQPEPKSGSELQHTHIAIPTRKPGSLGTRQKARENASAQAVTSSNKAQPESNLDEDSSTSAAKETSNVGLTAIKNGTNNAQVEATVPSLENTSKIASSDANAVLPTIKTVSKSQSDGPTIMPKGNNMYNVNGTPTIVPPGFTVDTYLAMRADLVTQPPKRNSKNRGKAPENSGTQMLTRTASRATPAPAPGKVASKKVTGKNNDKQEAHGTITKDLHQPSTPRAEDKASVKQILNPAKPKELTKPSPAVLSRNAKGTEAPVLSTDHLPAKPSISATKIRSTAPSSTSTRLAATPQMNGNPPVAPLAAKKPSTMSELKAQRAAERAGKMAAASSSKKSRTTNVNLVHGKVFSGAGIPDGASESESETETGTSSDGDVRSSSSSPMAKARQRRTPAKSPGMGIATVDLSIRDPSPSSDED